MFLNNIAETMFVWTLKAHQKLSDICSAENYMILRRISCTKMVYSLFLKNFLSNQAGNLKEKIYGKEFLVLRWCISFFLRTSYRIEQAKEKIYGKY